MRQRAATPMKVQAALCAVGAVASLRLVAALGRAHSLAHTAHTTAIGTSAVGDHQPESAFAAGLAALTYELLDAHADTMQLADGLPYDQSWAAHLDYLRALQRTGRETLARAAVEDLSFRHWTGWGSLDVR
jgi:hypothetical protein